MRRPSHTAFCSFIFSMILTSAFVPCGGDVTLAAAGAPAIQMAVQSTLNGMRAEGFGDSAKFDFPSAAVSPTATQASATVSDPNVPLPPELLSKMLRLIAAKGTDGNIPAKFVNALGMTATDQTWPDHQISAARNAADYTHGFALSREADQDLVISQRLPSSIRAYRAHRDGKIVAALIYDMQKDQITMRTPSEAQNELDTEFTFWAETVDRLIAGK